MSNELAKRGMEEARSRLNELLENTNHPQEARYFFWVGFETASAFWHREMLSLLGDTVAPDGEAVSSPVGPGVPDNNVTPKGEEQALD